MPSVGRVFGLSVSVMAVSIPLNGLHPLLPIGELRRDGFFYASLLFVVVYVLTGQAFNATRGIVREFSLFGWLLPVIAFGYVGNLETIQTLATEGRSGSSKFLTALLVCGYFGLFCVMLADVCAKLGVHEAAAAFARGILLASSCLCVFMAFETLSWSLPSLRPVVDLVRQSVVDGRTFIPFRLFGLSYEPSFNAFYLLFSLPWLDYLRRAGRASLGIRRLATVLLVVSVLFMLISSSRTAHAGLLLCAVYGTITCLASMMARPAAATRLAMCFLLATPALALIAQTMLIERLVSGGSLSNLTRMASVQAALSMYGTAPVFGVGLGQFGILYERHLPAFGWGSSEVVDYVYGLRGSVTAPSYNMVSLIMAELGTSGLLVWFLILRRNLWQIVAVRHRSSSREDAALSHALEYMLVIAIALMLSIGSFRLAQFWVPVAFVAALSVTCRRAQAPMQETAAGSS